MTPEALRNLQAALSVDARGTSCPGPRIEALKAIGTIGPGEIMEVLSADSRSRKEIPRWCRKQGLKYLGTLEESGYFKVYMQKK